MPLGIFAATIYARQIRLGVRVPWPGIGFSDGISATVFLKLSALLSWVLSHPEITTDVTLTHALSFLGFIAGGLGYVVGLGFLVAGLSELSLLSVPIAPLQILLPVGRFDGLPWLIAVGFLLPQVQAITGSGGLAVAMPADLTSEPSVCGLLAGIGSQFGWLDVAVNNAAGGGRPPAPTAGWPSRGDRRGCALTRPHSSPVPCSPSTAGGSLVPGF
ncbi:MAG: hypothetical protein M3021_10325 [Actinomycetota bacterium]|nr:hypothetical protein [Actinomycetota bacterium]